nr:hypothetical protein [Bacteroidota bacterium]
MKNYFKIIGCLIWTAIFCVNYSHSAYADTEVTPASGGTNLCLGGGYIVLGDIRVAEGSFSDFSSSTSDVTYIISAPNNFEFKAGQGTVK